MDFVDEQDVARTEICQRTNEISRLFQRRPRRRVQIHADFARDEFGERGLAKARGAVKEQVVEGLVAPQRRANRDVEALLYAALPDELGQPARPERELDDGLVSEFFGRGDLGARHRRESSVPGAPRAPA